MSQWVFWWRIFVKNVFGRDIFCHQFPTNEILILKSPEMVIISCKLKGCLRLSTFIFRILSNLAKFTYGSTPIEQHHILKKTNH
jgi:hypothetical protein